jgi:putative aldouronate transport system substrate-binding protein
MRTHQRILLLAAVLLSFSLLAGCTQTTTPTSAPSTATTTTKPASTTTQTTQPVAKPELKYLGRDATFDLSNSPIIPVIEAATGYVVNYESLPTGADGEMKLMMLIASGTSYDIINVPATYFDRLLAVNAARPLDDMIDNAPYLKEAVPPESQSWVRVTGEDGKKYAVPQLHPVDRAVSTIAYRKDLLTAIGAEVPNTPDEFKQVLKQVQEMLPDMIPFTTNKGFAAPPIESGFDVYRDWVIVSGQLVPNQKRTEYKAYIAYMRALYQEKLIDQEFPANDNATRLRKFTSGNAFMTLFNNSEGPGFYSALASAVPDSEIDYIPFLKDSQGNRGAMATSGGLEKACVIPKLAEHPDDAMAWIDAFMANFKDIYIGPEGIDHKVENGKYLPIMPAFSVHDTVWWFMPAVIEADVFDWWQARVRKSAEVERGYMDTFAMRTPDVNVVTSFFIMYPPNAEFIKLRTALSQYWSDEMVKVVTGAVPFEKYEEIVAKWETDGGSRYIELANEMWKANS